MFDNFFNSAKSYSYDVCNTLGRTASMMLSKGINMCVGSSAATDGKETIYLPQAMRRYLAWDEIDFVRYLVHHEHAHIKHSTSKQDVILASCVCNSDMFGYVINLLEDLRIEQLEINSSGGVAGVYTRGRAISEVMWLKYINNLDEDKMTVQTALCHLIYSGCLNPDFRNDEAIAKRGGIMELIHMKFVLAGVYERVDRIRDAVNEFPNTQSLSSLAQLICSLLGSGDPPGEIEPPKESLGKNEDGHPSDEQKELSNKFRMETIGCGQDTWADGRPEKMLEEELCDESLSQDQRVTEESINKGGGQHLSFGGNNVSEPNIHESRKNYVWAEWAAGMSSQVIDRLRGQERASLSRPRDSGVRIAPRNTVPFLQGLTNDLLRRKKKSPRKGTAVLFCIDDSGSMRGAFSQNAWRAAGMLCVACERAKIKTMVIRYSNASKVYKLFTQPPNALRNKLSIGMGGGTNAKEAIRQSIRHIDTRPEERKVIFFLSDGCTQDCRWTIRDADAKGIEFIPILFGLNAAYYSLRGREWDIPGCIVIPDPEKVLLGPVLVDRLASTL